MQYLKIVMLCVAAAVAYGVLHDQITARICVEYFTVAHPRVIESESPTQLALVWGVLATWWAGVLIGIPLACVSRIGRRRKLGAAELVKPLAVVLCAMGLISAIAGGVGYILARRGTIQLDGWLAANVPSDKHPALLADAAAHLAAYGSGLLGGIALVIYAWRSRSR
jgi:hypothetical protein